MKKEIREKLTKEIEIYLLWLTGGRFEEGNKSFKVEAIRRLLRIINNYFA